NTFRSFGVIATQRGSSPTGISAIFVLTSLPTSRTETEPLSGLTTQTKRSSWEIAIGLELVGNCFSAGAPREGFSSHALPASATTTTPNRNALLCFLMDLSPLLLNVHPPEQETRGCLRRAAVSATAS